MLLICVMAVQVSLAQKPVSPLSNLRTKYISTKTTQVKIDSLSLFPNTVSIANVTADQYQVDAVNAVLLWYSPLTGMQVG